MILHYNFFINKYDVVCRPVACCVWDKYGPLIGRHFGGRHFGPATAPSTDDNG